jgi:hypothetical protein
MPRRSGHYFRVLAEDFRDGGERSGLEDAVIEQGSGSEGAWITKLTLLPTHMWGKSR